MANWPCDSCLNHPRCIYITNYATGGMFCPGLERPVNNNTPRKEELISDIIHSADESEAIYSRDYKETLYEMDQSRKGEHGLMHDRIMDMPDETIDEIRRKCIAALLFFHVSAEKISLILKINVVTVYRIAGKG
jgi:hypothetical protein